MTSVKLTTLMLLGTLAGCSLAPTYHAPTAPPPPANAYQENDGWKQSQPTAEIDRGAWWSIYQDPVLDDLERRATDANQNLKAAFSRLQQARAETRIARADFFPTITAGGSGSRQRISENGPRFVTGLSKPTYNDFSLQADLSYEIDVFGRIRSAFNSAKADQQASAADLAALNLSTQADLATSYFSLRGSDAQSELLDKTVADYQHSLDLTQNLYQGGAAALTDVAQAQAQLQTAKTQAADIRLNRAQTEHAIAVLIGENPSAYHIASHPIPDTLVPPGLDPGLPSALLERRPDVTAAERRVASANAEIGVARAAYFPVFTLSGGGGYESTANSSWIDAPSRMWSIGPSAMLTLFDAGRHRAQSQRAHAVYDEQVADYRNTVLVAYQDVEDNLAALHQLELESVSETAAVAATKKALEQSQYRYKAGLVTYLEVSTNENAALQAQISNLTIQVRRMNASVLLVKALGGGWQSQGANLATNTPKLSP